MTKEEAKQIFLNRGFVEVDGGSIFDGDKWREACYLISQWLKREDCNFVVHKDRTNQEWIDRCRECGKQKKAEWLIVTNGQLQTQIKCSNCNYEELSIISDQQKFINDCINDVIEQCNYCPNCGRKMVRKE